MNTFPHRFMWQIVEEQAKLASEPKEGWSKPALVAMLFAFHTVEAYLNFVGDRLAPQIWKDEQNYFRQEGYRGFKGKLRKVMELVDLGLSSKERPLKTVYELKELRDMIAHGKPEKLTGETVHTQGSEVTPVSTLHSMFTPKEKLATAVCDVRQLLKLIHTRAAPKVKNDSWFGDDPLCGAEAYYSSGSTTLEPAGDRPTERRH